MRQSARARLMTGLVLIVLGIVLTIVGYLAAPALGGYFVVWTGMVLVGILRVLTALPGLRGARKASVAVAPAVAGAAALSHVSAANPPNVDSVAAASFARLPVDADVCWSCGAKLRPGRSLCMRCGAARKAVKPWQVKIGHEQVQNEPAPPSTYSWHAQPASTDHGIYRPGGSTSAVPVED